MIRCSGLNARHIYGLVLFSLSDKIFYNQKLWSNVFYLAFKLNYPKISLPSSAFFVLVRGGLGKEVELAQGGSVTNKAPPSFELGSVVLVSCITVQCSAVHFSAVKCSSVQCSTVQCSAVQCSAVQ